MRKSLRTCKRSIFTGNPAPFVTKSDSQYKDKNREHGVVKHHSSTNSNSGQLYKEIQQNLMEFHLSLFTTISYI